MSLYLTGVYGDEATAEWFRERYLATGKRMNMGKSCVRFTKLENLPLDLVERGRGDDADGRLYRARRRARRLANTAAKGARQGWDEKGPPVRAGGRDTGCKAGPIEHETIPGAAIFDRGAPCCYTGLSHARAGGVESPAAGRRKRGCSSVGRALQSHCRGQGFESPQLHRPAAAARHDGGRSRRRPADK